mmetsp:Transcript_96211/g.206494  ORF Transcript_96211/g.206494 Transcript_96211/m.206494 type:complete len:444 (+) Transcript_96211:721-2052(+)
MLRDIARRVGGHADHLGKVFHLPEDSSLQQELHVIAAADLVAKEHLLCTQVDHTHLHFGHRLFDARSIVRGPTHLHQFCVGLKEEGVAAHALVGAAVNRHFAEGVAHDARLVRQDMHLVPHLEDSLIGARNEGAHRLFQAPLPRCLVQDQCCHLCGQERSFLHSFCEGLGWLRYHCHGAPEDTLVTILLVQQAYVVVLLQDNLRTRSKELLVGTHLQESGTQHVPRLPSQVILDHSIRVRLKQYCLLLFYDLLIGRGCEHAFLRHKPLDAIGLVQHHDRIRCAHDDTQLDSLRIIFQRPRYEGARPSLHPLRSVEGIYEPQILVLLQREHLLCRFNIFVGLGEKQEWARNVALLSRPLVLHNCIVPRPQPQGFTPLHPRARPHHFSEGPIFHVLAGRILEDELLVHLDHFYGRQEHDEEQHEGEANGAATPHEALLRVFTRGV